jgi:protein SCO1/2
VLEISGVTPLADVVAYVDRLRASPDAGEILVGLLAEQSPIYDGRSTNEAERLRGYVLTSFENIGLPASAMAFVIEELETGLNAYTVAAAAKAVRGIHDPPEHLVPLMLEAIDRIASSDDVVCFEHILPRAGGAATTTALTELFRTFAWLGPRAVAALPALKAMLERNPSTFSPAVAREIEKAIAAVAIGQPSTHHSCCAHNAQPSSFLPSSDIDIGSIALQDQDGELFSFGEFFRGRPSALTFFYTRCMNPNKCSLSITKLGRLQQRTREEGLDARFNVAAITYDPAFDISQRLRIYGANRGLLFDDRTRLLRTMGPFDPVQRYFDLGVNYGSTTVNQHRIDLILLDSCGSPSTRFTRAQWEEKDVLAAMNSLS